MNVKDAISKVKSFNGMQELISEYRVESMTANIELYGDFYIPNYRDYNEGILQTHIKNVIGADVIHTTTFPHDNIEVMRFLTPIKARKIIMHTFNRDGIDYIFDAKSDLFLFTVRRGFNIITVKEINSCLFDAAFVSNP